MSDCILIPMCNVHRCNDACPKKVEINYLLSLNKITEEECAQFKKSDISKAGVLLQDSMGTVQAVSANDTIMVGKLIAYCSLMKYWRGNTLHSKVYTLQFSVYLELMKQGWAGLGADKPEFVDIWSRSSKILVITGLDFVNFKDFQAQTLLNLMYSRCGRDQTTFLVVPKSGLIGGGTFYSRLTELVQEGVVEW